MVSVCLSSAALLQHLPSYLGFSYLGHGVSLHGSSSKAQLLLLTLDEGYLLTAALPDLQRGIAPLGPPVPAQPLLLGHGGKEMQKSKMAVWGGLTNSCEKREAKSKGEKERFKHLNVEFQRIAKRDKKAFLNDQFKEIEETTE